MGWILIDLALTAGPCKHFTDPFIKDTTPETSSTKKLEQRSLPKVSCKHLIALSQLSWNTIVTKRRSHIFTMGNEVRNTAFQF